MNDPVSTLLYFTLGVTLCQMIKHLIVGAQLWHRHRRDQRYQAWRRCATANSDR